MAMKYGKVQKYDLEVVEKYDRKVGIFKAQHKSLLNVSTWMKPNE